MKKGLRSVVFGAAIIFAFSRPQAGMSSTIPIDSLNTYRSACRTDNTDIEQVRALIADPSQKLLCRYAAASRVLPHVGSVEDVALVKDLLAEFDGASFRQSLVLVIAGLGDYEILHLVEDEFFVDLSDSLRWIVPKGFCQFASKSAAVRRVIVAAMNDPDRAMFISGIQAAGCSGMTEFVPRLLEILDATPNTWADGYLGEHVHEALWAMSGLHYLIADFTLPANERTYSLRDWHAWWDSLNILVAVDCDPAIIRRAGGGRWLTCYLEFPDEPQRSDPVAAAGSPENVRLGDVQAEHDPKYGWVKDPEPHDHDGDGVLEFMVKFDRASVITAHGAEDEVTVSLSGQGPEKRFAGDVVLRFK